MYIDHHSTYCAFFPPALPATARQPFGGGYGGDKACGGGSGHAGAGEPYVRRTSF